jgi:hypothetical protein
MSSHRHSSITNDHQNREEPQHSAVEEYDEAFSTALAIMDVEKDAENGLYPGKSQDFP